MKNLWNKVGKTIKYGFLSAVLFSATQVVYELVHKKDLFKENEIEDPLTSIDPSLLKSIFNPPKQKYETVSPSEIPEKHDSFEPTNESSIDYSKISWKEAIKCVENPDQVKDYLKRHFSYKKVKKLHSFSKNHLDREGDCSDYSTTAAALLSDDGYDPYVLVTSGDTASSRHATFLYKTSNGYGILANGPSLKAQYRGIDDLVLAINKSMDTKYDSYFIANLK